jgi:hypothetical protein
MNILTAKEVLNLLANENYDERTIFSTAVEHGLATWIATMTDFGFTCTAGNSDGHKCTGLWFDNGEEFSERQNQYCIYLHSKQFLKSWRCYKAEINEIVFTDEGVGPDDTFHLVIE